MTEISNKDDVIDSRDVIERIAELRGMVSDGDANDDDKAELAALEGLANEASGCVDWEYGGTLIRDSYFVQYAQELADDIGAIPEGAGWPIDYIDWDAAADALKVDYTSVDFDGVTYWLRS